MELPQQIENFIEEQIEMDNMTLPWNYPTIEKFDEFQAGYRYNSITKEDLTEKQGEFHRNWFVICSNYFDDPFFIDITEIENNFPIYYAQHGAGKWTPIKISKSIIEFASQLRELKNLENNKSAYLKHLQSNFDLENEMWKEVYDSVIEEIEDEEYNDELQQSGYGHAGASATTGY